MVQWLGLGTLAAMTHVQSLVRDLTPTSCTWCGQEKKFFKQIKKIYTKKKIP